MTYNGELYGWPELRTQLASRGHRFHGRSDTEALLHLYEEQGDQLFEQLRGMFAFALFDRPRRRLLIGRDRMGVKPVYYHDDGHRLVFASELKALLQDPSVPRDVDPRAIADYLTHQYVPSPGTILSNVRKLPAGHYLSADSTGITVQRYWALPVDAAADDRDLGAEHYRDGLRALLEEAVKLRLVADVPLGAFLSGGIDSSAVVALMRKVSSGTVATFSVGFPDAQFSELGHARRVADSSRHRPTPRVIVSAGGAGSVAHGWCGSSTSRSRDASAIPTYYVSEVARRARHRCALRRRWGRDVRRVCQLRVGAPATTGRTSCSNW